MPATPNAAETTHGHLKEGRSTDSGLAEDESVSCSVTVNGEVVVEKTRAPGEKVLCLGVNPDAGRFG
jgi:hypothetical protein